MDEVQELFGVFLQIAVNYGNKMRMGEVPYDAESWAQIRKAFDLGFGAPLPAHPSELREPLKINFDGQPLGRIS